MFTYVVIAAAVLLVGAAVWVQVRGRNKPGRHIAQSAPTDDPRNAEARLQHDRMRNSQISGGGPG